MGIRVYLTGRISVEVEERLVVEERQLRGRQGRLLFAYLVLERNRTVPKEELANTVWAGEAPPTWEISLSALISSVRTLLGVPPLVREGVSLSRGSGQYELTMPADTWIDVEAGATAIDEAEGALRAGDPVRLLGPATVAVNVARRPFLAGIQGEWAESQRRRQERNRLRALDCISEMWLARNEPQLAVEAATEAVELDPLTQIHRRDDYAAAERAIGAREGDGPGTIWGRGGPVFVFGCRGETL